MAERLTKCKNCDSTSFDTIKEINPDTTEMNMRAILKCRKSGLSCVIANRLDACKRQDLGLPVILLDEDKG